MKLRSGRVVNEELFSQKEQEVAEVLCMMKNRKIKPNHYEKFKNEKVSAHIQLKKGERSYLSSVAAKII